MTSLHENPEHNHPHAQTRKELVEIWKEKFEDEFGLSLYLYSDKVKDFLTQAMTAAAKGAVESVREKLLEEMPVQASGDAQLGLDETRTIVFKTISLKAYMGEEV